MEFAIKKEARSWFRDIRSDLAIDFDAYYFCFIAGITDMKKEGATTAEIAPLVRNFPGPYKTRGRLLVALFLKRELEYLGIEIDEKKTVHAEISKLVEPNSPHFLSERGVEEFNKFAHGGYDSLLEWFDDRPRSLETFLRIFHQKIQEKYLQ